MPQGVNLVPDANNPDILRPEKKGDSPSLPNEGIERTIEEVTNINDDRVRSRFVNSNIESLLQQFRNLDK